MPAAHGRQREEAEARVGSIPARDVRDATRTPPRAPRMRRVCTSDVIPGDTAGRHGRDVHRASNGSGRDSSRGASQRRDSAPDDAKRAIERAWIRTVAGIRIVVVTVPRKFFEGGVERASRGAGGGFRVESRERSDEWGRSGRAATSAVCHSATAARASRMAERRTDSSSSSYPSVIRPGRRLKARVTSRSTVSTCSARTDSTGAIPGARPRIARDRSRARSTRRGRAPRAGSRGG